jgi:hypothetical protein
MVMGVPGMLLCWRPSVKRSVPEYKETLKKISKSRVNRKIRKYAKIAYKGLK